MIDWKRLPKIDAHIHLLPEDVIDANRGCGDTFVEYGSAQDYPTLMEQYNIEQAIIMPFNDPYMLSMDFTVESVHKNLQHMAETAQSRFFWYAEVDIRNEIDKTLSELERAITMDGCIGIKLHPTNAGYPIDGEYYDRVFRFASEQGIPVEIHSYPRTHLADDVCSPTRIRHVMVKYPQLKVSVAHLGGFQYRGLIGTNAYVNISAILPDLVSKFGIEKSNAILREFGVDKLIFATDYPDSRSIQAAAIYDRYFEILSQMDFTQAEAEAICKYNAQKMLGISLRN